MYCFLSLYITTNNIVTKDYGIILKAPSSRITSPFSIGFSIILCTNCANSAGSPNRFGNGVAFDKNAITLSGRFANKGVLNKPNNFFINLN